MARRFIEKAIILWKTSILILTQKGACFDRRKGISGENQIHSETFERAFTG
jgi:hypothetical protein